VAEVLAELLPGDVEEGSVSTLPLGWADEAWTDDRDKAARANLERLAGGLDELGGRTGRRVRVAVEPEPGCVVETMAEATGLLDGLAPEWIGACLDTCHLAVQFEEPGHALADAATAGATIVKAQLSSALRVPDPADHAWLHDYDEPRFLHQTRERVAYEGPRVRNGVAGVDDLGRVGGLPGRSEWRVHFHVPVHADDGHTTQPELRSALRALAGGAAPATRHLEVETYTWTVLPAAERPADDAGLIAGLARELAWTADQLADLGLEPR
jgi:hypothetical protein